MLLARNRILVRNWQIARKITLIPKLTRLHCVNMTSEVQFSSSMIDIDTDAYPSQLAAKQKLVEEKFAEFSPPALEVFQSKPKNYRMR